jgi:hypothetical protein
MTDLPDTTASNPTGMAAVKAALRDRKPGERSMSWLSRRLGLSRGAVLPWEKVPEEHLRTIMEITGLTASVLRPDLAELFGSN